MSGRTPGPPRQPADVIELHGNKSKLSKEELEARRSEEVKAEPIKGTTPPAGLSRYARECWAMHAPELERLGLLSRLDLGAFRVACETYAMALEALEAMRPRKKDGTPDKRSNRLELLVADSAHAGRLAKHPAFAIFNMAANTYRGYCVDFGLTPSARVTLRPGTAGASTAGSVSSDDGDEAFDFGT